MDREEIIARFKALPCPASPSKLYDVRHFLLNQQNEQRSPGKNIAFLVNTFRTPSQKSNYGSTIKSASR